LLAAAASIAAPAVAHADDPPPRRPAFQLQAELDIPLLLGGGALSAAILFRDETPGVSCGLSCNRANVNVFDRWAAGRYDPSWGQVGDIATATTVLFGPLVVVLGEGIGPGLSDALVIGEAALLTSALQVPLSYAIARPRPRAYAPEAPVEERTDANAARSFFSGHTADAVAVTVATTRVFHRLGYRTAGWVVFAAGMTGSTLAATGRVLSGGHFPSDVLMGAAVGAGFGLLVPWLHERRLGVGPAQGADSGGLAVSGRF